ncbi:MAG: hypothetical protein ACD_71C00113G0006 [uncultured bacterium (gcode 4)]|uniref:SLH domain-containing protein n=1 Tax=uncultured bacterium (gcode 4) TaxID=1234023 RepID=K2A3C1_9BACT|nr:MAG: hypothetical protein ACD_71C00113G0006 [uncultured bacterium (gcode 4)]
MNKILASIIVLSLSFISQAHADVLSDNGLDSSIYQKLNDIKWTDFEDVILKSYQKGIIKWYANNTFKPNANVSFSESLKIIILAWPKWTQVQKSIKTKDPRSIWSESDYLLSVYNNGDQTTERSFKNDDKVTRDFSVYLMLRQIGVSFEQWDLTKLNIPNQFSDVTSDSKFAPYLAFAWHAWISSWYGDWTFWGNRNITRWELTKMSYKTLIDNKEAILQKYRDLKYQLDSKGNKVSITYKKGMTYFKTAEEIKQFITQDKLVVSPDIYSKSFKETLNPTGQLGGPRDGYYTEMFFNYVDDIKKSWKVVQIPTYLMPTFIDVSSDFGWKKAVNSTVIDLGIMSKVDLSSSPEIKATVKYVEEVASKRFPDYIYFNKSDYRGDTIRVGAVWYFRWDLMKEGTYRDLQDKLDADATKETSDKLTTEFYNLMMKEWFSSKDWGLVSSPSKWNDSWSKWDLSIVYLPAQAESNLSKWRVVEKGDYLYQIKVKPSSLMWYWNWTIDKSKLEINPSIYWNVAGVSQPIFQYILWRGEF